MRATRHTTKALSCRCQVSKETRSLTVALALPPCAHPRARGFERARRARHRLLVRGARVGDGYAQGGSDTASQHDQYTENGKHVFTFHRFFHGHITKKKWKEDYQVTQQMLKEHCGCEEGRMVIGKKKPSIMKVDTFEKPEDQFTQKKLKEEDPY